MLETLTEQKMQCVKETPVQVDVEEQVDLYGIAGTYRNSDKREPFAGFFVQKVESKEIVGRVHTSKGLEFTVTGVYDPSKKFRLTLSMPHGHVTNDLLQENVVYPGRESEKRWAVNRQEDRNYELIVAVAYLGLSS